MPDSSLHTTQLRRWVERIRKGDRAACDEMLRAAQDRLERLARKMLRRFPDYREPFSASGSDAGTRSSCSARALRPFSAGDLFLYSGCSRFSCWL